MPQKETARFVLRNFPRGLTSGSVVKIELTGRVTGFSEPEDLMTEDGSQAVIELETSGVSFEPLTFRDAAEQAQTEAGRILFATPSGIGQSTLPST
jgi:hypothetical protein